jgi:hypothetical protein
MYRIDEIAPGTFQVLKKKLGIYWPMNAPTFGSLERAEEFIRDDVRLHQKVPISARYYNDDGSPRNINHS